MAREAEIWLVGAGGMLGRQLAGEFAARNLPFLASDREVDVCDRRALEGFLRGRRPAWIVNCAAYTAVDRAEDEPEAAFAVNALGVENLARLAAATGAAMVHFSTDYVFAGDRAGPYRETDGPRPLSAYGRSKLEGERRLAACLESHFLLRVSWLYGVHGANFVVAMMRRFAAGREARVVCDQFGSPTYAGLLAANVAGLVASHSQRYGTFHYCDEGVISWFDFATAIQEEGLAAGLLARPIAIAAIPTAEYPARAQRPLRAALDTSRARLELGLRVRPWRENLKDYFAELGRPAGRRP